MKYFPKSKLGAVIAGLYLLLVIALSVPLIASYGDSNVHSGNVPFAMLIVFLTLPLNLLAFYLLDLLTITNKSAEQVVTFAVLSICAIVNAIVIYFVVGFISRMFKAVFRYFGKGNTMEEKL
jgi:hypothetical protein